MFFGCLSYPKFIRILFLGHNSLTKNSILVKNSFPSRYMYNVSLQKNSKISSTNCSLQNLPKD
jgi:hypothetical protein